MRLSAAKINHIAHLVADLCVNESAISCVRPKNDIRLRVKIIITDELKLNDDIDRNVRRTINSMQKSPPEGSREWEVLYEKYYEEEMNRRRRVRADGIRRMH
ncbi:DUF507 family protein [bacterium]|nr:DUF507 family protein [candidate division CSSED10-310 bacterium]